MGLRINTNVAALSALRNLGVSDKAQQTSLERLSTGLRINRAADDPAGLVISTQLRAQYTSMEQALDNSQNASNLIGTAEAALAEVHDLLIKIRESCIYSLNEGAANTEQIQAEQDSVDSAIQAIDRIAKTTRFGTRSLLNGASEFRYDAAVQSAEIQGLNIRQVNFDGQSNVDFYLDVVASGLQAAMTFTSWTVGSGAATASMYARMRVTGMYGSEVITFAQGTTVPSAAAAINLVTGNTGVYASNNGGTFELYSVDHGAKHSAIFEFVDGNCYVYSNAACAAGDIVNNLSDAGQDMVAFVNGNKATCSGLYISVTSTGIIGDIKIDPTAYDQTATYTFRVYESGLDFQMNTMARPSDMITIGLQSMETLFLGSPEYTLTNGPLQWAISIR